MLYKKKKWMAAIFIAPFVIFAGVFLLYPFISNCINAFFLFNNRNQSFSEAEFVGWQNFADLVSYKAFGLSIANTFILIAFVVVFQMGIALILALMVDRIKKAQGFYRVVFFIPIVLSGSLIGSMFSMFVGGLDGIGGLFNDLLGAFGGITPNADGVYVHAWLSKNDYFGSLLTLLVPVVWQYIGFYFVILLTGLTNISNDIMEAAALDGATTFQQIRFVTLPMLWNVLRTCMVLSITGALKVYDVPYMMTAGWPTTYFMGTYNQSLFDAGSNTLRPGYKRIGESSIYSIILVLTGIIVSQLSNTVFRENKDI